MNEKIYQYYVEGENEKKIVNVLLEQCGFNMGDFWNTTPQNSFNTFGKDSEKVRIQK